MSTPILTTKQAATYCGLTSAQTLYNLISQGDGPKRFKRGRLNAFYESDLDEWNRNRLTPVSQSAKSPQNVRKPTRTRAIGR